MPISDRQKQRRKYQLQAAGAVGKGLIAAFLLLFFVLCIAQWGFDTLMWMLTPSTWFRSVAIETTVLSTLLIAGYVFACWGLIRFIKKTDKEYNAIPSLAYITPDNLPAEEVLVRGAQKPSQEQRLVLLRAAGENDDMPAAELLRATIVQNHVEGL